MPQSQNGWPVIDGDRVRVWKVPGPDGRPLRYPSGELVLLPLARGAAGFLLTHHAAWYHVHVESLTSQRQRDDWGWAPRNIRGSSTISNHASGTAVDLNATAHPLGVATRDTFSARQVDAMHRRLRWLRVLRWGGDYKNRPDAMHHELDAGKAAVVARVARLVLSKRGRAVVKLNPWGQR